MMKEVEDIYVGNLSKSSRHNQIKAKTENIASRVQQTQQSHRKYQRVWTHVNKNPLKWSSKNKRQIKTKFLIENHGATSNGATHGWMG